MNSNAAAAEFITVANKIIGLGLCRPRLFIQLFHMFRHGEVKG